MTKKKNLIKKYGIPNFVLLVLVLTTLAFNQYNIVQMQNMHSMPQQIQPKQLGELDFGGIKSTGHAVAEVFPVEDIKTTQDAVNVMIPQGTPDYGVKLGISYDDPTGSLAKLVQLYRLELTQDEYERYLNLVRRPMGISCEFCCGLNAIGVDEYGRTICGCQHNPALLGLTKFMIKYTDYSDAEILREVLRWKSLFFPKDMVNLALTVAGGDTSQLDELPGMVGGC